MKNTTTQEKKAALYDPYLDTMGGGENHILSILKVLDDHGYHITIYWDTDLSGEIERKFDMHFQNIQFRPNIFRNGDLLTKSRELARYDSFFYVTDGSYFFSSAKKNFVFCMVPLKSLYSMNIANKLKTRNFSFISNSKFTKNWLDKWGIKSDVLYPYLSDNFFTKQMLPKEKIILNVGRFFKQLHAKRQDIAIQWFIDLQKQNPDYREYELHLAGSLSERDQPYLEELYELAKENKNIYFHTNVSYQEVLSLYHKAEYYWHFAGYSVDEKVNPERTEHLGITPIEAMASGCLTYAYRAGGPAEIITDGTNGFLFKSQEELFSKMKTDPNTKNKICETAKKFVQESFSYDTFKKSVEHIILNL